MRTISWRMDEVILLGRPPAHRGAREAMPARLKAWITSRTRSGAPPQARAISEARAPPGGSSPTASGVIASSVPPQRGTYNDVITLRGIVADALGITIGPSWES